MQPGQDPPELAPGHRVDTCGRFVEQQQVGLVHQGGGQHQLLLHAAGEELGLPVGELGQPHAPQQCLGPRPSFGTGDPADGGEEVQVFGHREVGVHREPLAHVADPRRDCVRLLRDRATVHLGVTGVGVEHGGEHPDQRRLARSVGAEQTEHRTERDLKVQVVDSHGLAERAPQATDADGWLGFRDRRSAGFVRLSRRTSDSHQPKVTSTGMPALSVPVVSLSRTLTS